MPPALATSVAPDSRTRCRRPPRGTPRSRRRRTRRSPTRATRARGDSWAEDSLPDTRVETRGSTAPARMIASLCCVSIESESDHSVLRLDVAVLARPTSGSTPFAIATRAISRSSDVAAAATSRAARRCRTAARLTSRRPTTSCITCARVSAGAAICESADAASCWPTSTSRSCITSSGMAPAAATAARFAGRTPYPAAAASRLARLRRARRGQQRDEPRPIAC